jgi:hypothetical protein
MLQVKDQAEHISNIEKDKEELNKEIEHLRGQCEDATALKEQLNAVTEQQDELKKQGNDLMLQVNAERISNIEKDKEELNKETEPLRGQCKDYAALKELRDNLISEAKEFMKDCGSDDLKRERELRSQCGESIKKYFDARKLEKEKLRSHCEEVVALIEERNKRILEIKESMKDWDDLQHETEHRQS